MRVEFRRSGVPKLCLVVLGVLSLLLSGCAEADGDEIAATQDVSTTVVPTTTEPVVDSVPDVAVPDRFGDFPAEPSDEWRIGVEYIGTRLTSADGVELGAASVIVQFAGRSNVSVRAGGCSNGSGTFDLVDGRLENLERSFDLVLCTPSDQAVHDAVEHLMSSMPEIRVDDARLLLIGGGHRLQLETSEAGAVVIIEDNERFVGIESTIEAIEPARIELTAPAFFVVVLTMPSCQVHGGTPLDGSAERIAFPDSAALDPCEFSPEQDKAAQQFFEAGTTPVRDGDELIVSNDMGSVTLRLVGGDTPPLPVEEQVPPPLEIPALPDRSRTPEAGRSSQPWFDTRAGSTAPGSADVPLPEEWAADAAGIPSVRVVGRGSLSVAIGQTSFDPQPHSETIELVEGPTELTVKLYTLRDGQVVESGTTAPVLQYRYGSSDPNEWLREVIWVVDLGDSVAVATVSYPEFPPDSGSGGDPRNQALTGLDPLDLLYDIRFFE